MKKIILTAAAVFAFSFANAQSNEATDNGFSEGDKFVEGGFSIRSSDSGAPNDVSSSFSFTPKMGYMLTDAWAIGGFLDFAGAKQNDNDKTGIFGIGAFARYYFLSLGASRSFNAYGELGLGYSSISNNPNIGNTTNNSAMNANIDLGMNYFFTPHFAATFTLANILSYNNSNPENGSNTSNLEVNINLFNNIFAQPQFGLLYKW